MSYEVICVDSVKHYDSTYCLMNGSCFINKFVATFKKLKENPPN